MEVKPLSEAQKQRYIPKIEQLGMRAIATDIIMTTPERAARLSEAVLRELQV